MRIVLAMALLAACGQAKPKVDPATIPTATIKTSAGEIAFHLEIATTPSQKAQGLMYRDHLANDRGMLFIYDYDAVHSFWMKNVPIPLDMIFISRDLQIVGIVHNAEPQTTTSRTVARPSRYVLEIAGGLAKKRSIKDGDMVRFSGFALP